MLGQRVHWQAADGNFSSSSGYIVSGCGAYVCTPPSLVVTGYHLISCLHTIP